MCTKRQLQALALLAVLANGHVLAQDCAGTRPATQQDLAHGEGITLLNDMAAACRSPQPENFLRLQTSSARGLAHRASDRASLVRTYCEFTEQALNTLGGNAAAGLHSIGPYKGRSRCGVLASYWFVHAKSGELALRLAVAVEGGRLRIDTH